MRILHLTRDLPPASKGGISTAVGGLIAALGDAGHPCDALSFDGWRPSRHDTAPPALCVEEGANGQVLRVSGPAELEQAKRFSLTCAPDLIHVHHGMLWEFAATLIAALKVPGIFTLHVHQASLNALRGVDERTSSLDGQERALREADLVCTPSRACSAAVARDYPEVKPWTTRLGIQDSARIRGAAEARSPTAPERLTYVGRFADVKGTREFLAVARSLLSRRPGLRVRVVGGVPDNPKADRRWRRRWREETAPERVERLEFVGWASGDELTRHLREASVLLVPSWTETFGLTVLEGMLHGVPIVASACPAIAELLVEGQTGLMVPPKDIGAYVTAVERLLDDPAFALELARNAAAVARQHHLWGACAVDTIEAYHHVISRDWCSAGHPETPPW